MDSKLIERINELAKKKKAEGLNEKEQKEQKKLYKEYLSKFRASFDKQLDNIDVTTPDGETTPLKEFHKKRKEEEKKEKEDFKNLSEDLRKKEEKDED